MSPLALKEILKLSVSERVQLAEDIWDSIAADPESLPVTDAQKRVLDIRREAHSNDPGSTRSWEEIRADLDKIG
ncbi:MAG TPA: addiction module protein [Nitrospira sp.]|nr:addiction module protein [Nitrospira sp.]